MGKSPNSVLANVLTQPLDLIGASLREERAQLVVLEVGAQLNAPPHVGTGLVLACCFALAGRIQAAYGVPARVRFTALDNAPHELRADPALGHLYQRSVHHACGPSAAAGLLERHYRPLLEAFARGGAVPYEVETYTQAQSAPEFRREFLSSLAAMDLIGPALSPAGGQPHLRFPCPACGWAEKRAERTRVSAAGPRHARVRAVCVEHGPYEMTLTEEPGPYVDLATLYRNYVKERIALGRRGTLPVMVKGADWALASPLVDRALRRAGVDPPPRIFCPMVLDGTGAKLAKSQPGATAAPDASTLFGLAQRLLADPRDFFRHYTVQEIDRLMNDDTRTWDLTLFRESFDLVRSGRKSVEVRVSYPKFRDLAPGHRIRFTSDGLQCLTRVRRLARYTSFEELLDTEGAERVNPDVGRDEQLGRIRTIYPPEKETLGPLAIELELV
ncbi:ASCH domain-containing protein [Nonomuraea sp. NPDC049480]|uniref:ASCH domain-containing protein n=1 Tax=Nonomuraea sp. NPDC049480 TaxID=3364353 RepID=UPI00378F1087